MQDMAARSILLFGILIKIIPETEHDFVKMKQSALDLALDSTRHRRYIELPSCD